MDKGASSDVEQTILKNEGLLLLPLCLSNQEAQGFQHQTRNIKKKKKNRQPIYKVRKIG